MQTTTSEQMNLSLDQVLQLSQNIVVRKNHDDTVIVMRLDESALFYKIDGIAAKVWSSLTEPRTPREIISEFAQIYPHNSNQLEQDVPGFLMDLLNKNLVVKC